MTRQEFMKRLEELLADISVEERDEAIAYYTSYFEDAGIENEEKVLRELESPEKVAATIKADLAGGAKEGEYTENGFQTEKPQKQEVINRTVGQQSNAGQQNSTNQGSAQTTPPVRKKMSGGMVALIVIALVLTIPVWGGLLTGLVGIIFGIIGVLIGIICALFGIAVGGIVGGFALLGVAIATIAAGGFALGLVLAGIGALLIAMGMLALILLVQYCGRFLPFLIRGIAQIFQNIFYRRRGYTA